MNNAINHLNKLWSDTKIKDMTDKDDAFLWEFAELAIKFKLMTKEDMRYLSKPKAKA